MKVLESVRLSFESCTVEARKLGGRAKPVTSKASDDSK